MSRAELAQELAVVARTLVLAAAVLENLSFTLRSPQDGPDLEDDAPVVPVVGMPTCTCPPCLAERARGKRP